jgi:hypothetical protein
MQLQVLQVLPNGALNCQLTLTRANSSSNTAARGSHQTTITGAWGTAAAGTTGSGAAGGPVAGAPAVAERKIYTSFTPCKLLCGCSSTDQLLLMRSMVLETFESPMQVSSRPSDELCDLHVTSALLVSAVSTQAFSSTAAFLCIS